MGEFMLSNMLINQTLNYFSAHSHRGFVVKPSLPILYFGDLDEYLSSPLKVVTVGKNPSDNEFRLRKTDPYSFCRFKRWNPDNENLIESLNPYFRDEPLSWFSCYEPVLKGMGCSYYSGGVKNRALHTDICSPIATSPTWSKLLPENQVALYHEGYTIWNQLVEELQPDILLISVPQGLFSKHFRGGGRELLGFTSKADGSPRMEKYTVTEHSKALASGKLIKVIYGQAAQTPFGTISSEQKMEIGSSCLR
jgi:hypothetical protein